MKIAFVTQSLGKGGAERLCIDIANEIQSNYNHEVLIVSLGTTNQYDSLTKSLNIKYVNTSVSLSLFKKNKIDISEFEAVIAAFKPDVIHSHVYKSELVSREKLINDISYFSHCHNNMPEFRAFSLKTLFNKALFIKYYEKRRIEKKYRACDNQFVAVSKDTFSYFTQNLDKRLRKNVHFLTNAIDYAKFYNTDKRHVG